MESPSMAAFFSLVRYQVTLLLISAMESGEDHHGLASEICFFVHVLYNVMENCAEKSTGPPLGGGRIHLTDFK